MGEGGWWLDPSANYEFVSMKNKYICLSNLGLMFVSYSKFLRVDKMKMFCLTLSLNMHVYWTKMFYNVIQKPVLWKQTKVNLSLSNLRNLRNLVEILCILKLLFEVIQPFCELQITYDRTQVLTHSEHFYLKTNIKAGR